MSAAGRPESEYRSAQHGGDLICAKGSSMSVRALAALALALGGCMSLAPQSPTLVGVAQDGRSVHLHKGDTLVVALATHADGDDRWRVQPLQGPVLQQIGMLDLLPQQVAEGTTGSANDNVYRFRAREVGTTTLELAQQAPPGATGAAPPRSVHYRVSVSAMPGEYTQAWVNSR